jgi:hypothetical protein
MNADKAFLINPSGQTAGQVIDLPTSWIASAFIRGFLAVAFGE